MGVLFGRERRQWTAEPPIPPYPGANIYGQPSVNTQPDRALIVPTVWGCVQLLANAVAMLPLMTYRRTADVPARITDPPLVQTPAADMTQSEWLHELMVSLLLSPDRVQPQVDEDTGDVRYFVGPSRVDMTDRIWHVRGMTLPGKKLGLSPIEYAAEAIGVDLASRKFASDFFSGGGIPKAVLESDMDITQEQARTLKDRLMAATRNREPVALGSGVKYNQISVKPNES